MKKNKFKINLILEDKLPLDFSITYDELADWHLGKYKPNPKILTEMIKLDLKSLDEVDIVYENQQSIAGRFNIKFKEGNIVSSSSFDFMIAKHIYEITKNRSATKSPIFSKLHMKQVNSIHAKFVDQIMPACLEKLRLHKEFLRQKRLNEAK